MQIFICIIVFLTCDRWLQSVRLRHVMPRNRHPGCRQSWPGSGRICRIKFLRKMRWDSRWLRRRRRPGRPLFLPSRRSISLWVSGCPSYYITLSSDTFFSSSVLLYCSSAFYLHLNLSPKFSNLNLCPASKDQLQKENEELKQQREELEVRVSALKSQYEGRLSRQERELRDLRGQQERQEQRDEPPEAGPSKVRVCFKVFTSQEF